MTALKARRDIILPASASAAPATVSVSYQEAKETTQGGLSHPSQQQTQHSSTPPKSTTTAMAPPPLPGSARVSAGEEPELDAASLSQDPSERQLCIGAVLLSVNGLRTSGLSFVNIIALLQTEERPITLEFVDSWSSIFHSHLIETQVRDKITHETFEQKMNHPMAKRLREQVKEWLAAFREQDLSKDGSRPDEGEKPSRKLLGGGGGGAAQGQQAPEKMLWSLIKWVEQELPEVGVFSNNHRAGGGLPMMGALQWQDVHRHLERYIFGQVYTSILRAAPDYGKRDKVISARLASLRFLQPRHWCVGFLPDRSANSAGNGGSGYGREWELAQRELCKVTEYCCPTDMIASVQACVRLVALAVEASMSRSNQELQQQSAQKSKPKQVLLGADDLLAALSWVVVQANPTQIGSRMWLMERYMREGEAGSHAGGEAAYCLTQLASALEFATSADASVLADISQSEFEEGLARYEVSQSLIEASAAGDAEAVAGWLQSGANPNELSLDQQNTALTASVRAGSVETVKVLLSVASTDINARVSPCHGPSCGKTALMFASEAGNLALVLLLLGYEGCRRSLTSADGKTAMDYAVVAKHHDVVAVLQADPSKVSLCEAAMVGSMPLVRALLLQGVDHSAPDPSGQYTPLIAAAVMGHIEVLRVLAGYSKPNINGTNTRGETALMYCVQREAHATPATQARAAIILLEAGANRYHADHDGRSALDWAEKWGSARLSDIIRYDPTKVTIYHAARDRDERGVMALLEQGVDPNSCCPRQGYSALLAAVANKDIDMMRILLQHKGCDANSRDPFGRTALFHAAQQGHESIVALLLKSGADRYTADQNGTTSLGAAASRGHTRVADMLRCDASTMSICACAARGNARAVQALVKQGVDINSRHRIRDGVGWHHARYTALIAACSAGQGSLVRELLGLTGEIATGGGDGDGDGDGAVRVQVNQQNLLGQTALMYAAAKGEEHLILNLLAAGASRDIADLAGRTAVWWCTHGKHATGCASLVHLLKVDPAKLSIQEAAASGNVDDVVALLRQGVSPSHRAEVDMLALFEAHKDVPELRRLADIYRSSFEPQFCPITPLAVGAITGRDAVIRLLLDENVNVNERDSAGRTPLMHAARFGNERSVMLLLMSGAGRLKRDVNGKTACDLAISSGHLNIAGLIAADPSRLGLHEVCEEGKLVLLMALLKQGAQVNTPRPKSRYSTPLMAACAHKRASVVKVLLSQPNIDLDARNSRGETALMIAARAGGLGICRLLILNGATKSLRDKGSLMAEHHAYAAGHLNMVLYKVLQSITSSRITQIAQAEERYEEEGEEEEEEELLKKKKRRGSRRDKRDI
ncbi:unnamed protein product [Chrysoparadoxa australica]